MNSKMIPVSLMILGKEYKIACAEEEYHDLVASAQQLDKQMRRIRDSGKALGPDRIAVMAALNLTHELKQQQRQNAEFAQTINSRLQTLREKIERALPDF